MFKAIVLRLHRWTTLVFALPLAAVILTGLVLSFEPIVQTLSVTPGSLDAAKLDSLLARHDPEGRARGMSIDPFGQRMSLQGGATIDLATGEKVDGRAPLADFFLWSRRTHERLIGQLGWLVEASTIAMLALIALGVLMGLPHLRNSISGWHKGVAWFTLPLLILSPLTGLFLVWGITLQGAPAGGGRGAPARGQALPLREAVKIVAQSKDPSRILSISQRGGRLLARVDENGGMQSYEVTAQGLRETSRNWPRALHEGNWHNLIGSIANIIVSAALILLMGTGLTIWARRTFRRRRRTRAPAVAAAE